MSTSIVPVNASDSSSKADVSSGDESSERPVQDSIPDVRLAASGPGSLLTAGGDRLAHGNSGARPAATRDQARSTTRVPNGQSIYRPHQQPPDYHNAAQSTHLRYQHGSTSGERTAVPNAQSAFQLEDRPGGEFVNGPFSSSSESLSVQSVIVTTTNAQGSQVVHTVPAAVIRVPVRTSNNEGKSIVTESLLTAAATASVNDVVTSINDLGSTVLQTSQVPAVVYTITDSQGSAVVIKSAVVPSSVAGAVGQVYASPEDGRPESPPDSSNGVGRQGYQQTPPETGSKSSSSTTESSQAFDYSSSASPVYNASDLKVGSGYDQLAKSGLAALAENASTIAQFVQDRLADQTNEQKQAFRSQLDAQFTRFVDDLFAAPASAGQSGSQQTAAEPDLQSSQDLANQTCSSLGEMHEQLITNVFFMETTVSTIFWQYTNVRDVIIKQCR